MITSLFVPTKINNYYILTKTSAALRITATSITVTVIQYKGTTTKLLDSCIIPINQVGQSEGILDALKAAKQRIGKVDELRILIPSSQVLFRQLILPFAERAQIRMVLATQLEGIVPFVIQDSYVDFIITHQESDQSTILVAIATKEFIDGQLELCHAAGLFPTIATVDCLGVWRWCKKLFNYNNRLLIIPELYQTALIVGGAQGIQTIRTIKKGFATIATIVANRHQLELSAILGELNKLLSTGNAGNDVGHELIEQLRPFIDELQFTLQAMNKQTVIDGIDVVSWTDISWLKKQLNESTGLEVTARLAKDIVTQIGKEFGQPNLDPAYLFVAAALDDEIDTINLLVEQQEVSERKKIARGLLVSAALFLSLIFLMGGYLLWQQHTMNRKVEKAKKEAIAALAATVKIDDSAVLRNLDDTLETARAKVERDKAVWFAFSPQARIGFLKSLQELSTIIDKSSTGLEIRKMILEPTTITLSGSVRGYPELKILEDEINESGVLALANAPQEPKFTLTILVKE